MRFSTATVLVTGASRGIGSAIATAFAEEGADVVVTARTREALAETARAIEGMGRRCLPLAMDVVDSAAVDAGVAAALEAFGKIDVCVNNAGITKDMLLIRMTDAEWDDVMETNLKGAFRVTRSVAKAMVRQRKGAIVNITSIIGLIGNAGQCNYSASKAGMVALTKSAAKELASRGIRVNAIAPGFIETGMTDALPPAVKATVLDLIPLGRFGSAEDIAKATLFLASEDAAYVTGQTLSVNGGMAMM
ncbi:MAG: 3-oxoacyl-[acyl-carrier-protein] reductase [Kiritimatiellaeota bacterium]|nr:3-oxoacyl-[acyl-carrier-protein] reductase [Kiritimatiellota bacterium]